MATSVHRIINGFLIMFTASEHLHGWLVYGGGAVLGLLCWWYLLIKLPVKPIRSLLFGAMVGALCMPWPTEDGGQFFAPAWLIAGSDGLFDGADAFWRAGTPLLMAIDKSVEKKKANKEGSDPTSESDDVQLSSTEATV